jgi:hypothetical protein
MRRSKETNQIKHINPIKNTNPRQTLNITCIERKATYQSPTCLRNTKEKKRERSPQASTKLAPSSSQSKLQEISREEEMRRRREKMSEERGEGRGRLIIGKPSNPSPISSTQNKSKTNPNP